MYLSDASQVENALMDRSLHTVNELQNILPFTPMETEKESSTQKSS